MHKTIITGHIGQNPELRKTNTAGVDVCNLSVAVNESWTDKATQTKRESTEWYRVVCWNGLARTVAQYMAQGRQVLVEGRMKTREYEVQHKDAAGQLMVYADGTPLMVKRSVCELHASNVEFLGKKPQDNAYVAPVAGAAVAAAVAAPAAGYVAPVATPPAAAAVVPPVVGADPNAVAGTFVQPVSIAPPAGV